MENVRGEEDANLWFIKTEQTTEIGESGGNIAENLDYCIGPIQFCVYLFCIAFNKKYAEFDYVPMSTDIL